jgi:Astacin (Peptidase family M12A)
MTENLDRYCVCMTDEDLSKTQQLSSEDRNSLGQRRAAVLKSTAWKPGAEITIRFLDGDRALQKRVEAAAREWMDIANLRFVFRKSAPTDIRIAFMPGKGSWSYLGTVCKRIPEPQPTMNYGWLTPQSSEDELRRVVLHEFGHAIGLIHEHQNPKGGINWNRPAVVKDLSGSPNFWDAATIDNNIFKHYLLSDVDASPVDSKSIMMYPIPKAWTVDGFSAGLNSKVSATDKTVVGKFYPR